MEQAKPEEFAHPYPIERRGPDLGSRHRCMVLIRAYQQQGHISPCVHAQPTVIATDRQGARYYGVRCARDSFDIRRPPPGTFRRGIGVAAEPLGFYGCPRGCHYQQTAWQAGLQQLREVPGRLLAWFVAESWQVKVAGLALLGALLLAVRGPETIRALTELVRAVTAGK